MKEIGLKNVVYLKTKRQIKITIQFFHCLNIKEGAVSLLISYWQRPLNSLIFNLKPYLLTHSIIHLAIRFIVYTSLINLYAFKRFQKFLEYNKNFSVKFSSSTKYSQVTIYFLTSYEVRISKLDIFLSTISNVLL